MCLSILITSDTILENDEAFSAHLSTADQDVILGPVYASITIMDDDCKDFADLCCILHSF